MSHWWFISYSCIVNRNCVDVHHVVISDPTLQVFRVSDVFYSLAFFTVSATPVVVSAMHYQVFISFHDCSSNGDGFNRPY